MEAWTVLAPVLAAVLLGAISPGPSFMVVARTAVGTSRRAGVAAAIGMGLGGMLFSILALAGIHTLLQAFDWLYAAIKIAGGLYLVWMAVKIWRGAQMPFTVGDGAPASGNALLQGLATQLSNPKTALFYASVFGAVLPAAPPPWTYAALPLLVLAVETGWYAVVAFGFSSPRPQALYLSARTAIDRTAAAVIGLLGLRLLAGAGREGL
ncbi:MAG TPA: LysE family transporter [Burkholderiaceae bacterium]